MPFLFEALDRALQGKTAFNFGNEFARHFFLLLVQPTPGHPSFSLKHFQQLDFKNKIISGGAIKFSILFNKVQAVAF